MTATPPPAPDSQVHCGEADWVPGSCPGCPKCDPVNYPAPDTRPRCGGTPGNGGLLCFQHGIYHPQTSHVKACYCSGCADCAQPAPTPSGDEARREYRIEGCDHGQAFDVCRAGYGTVAHCGGEADARQIVAGLIAAAALQEARERAEWWKARAGEYESAVGTIQEAQHIAVNRAEAAEQRLREVEGERDALRDVEMAAREVIRILLGTEDQEPCGDCDPEELCAMHGALGDLSEALVDYATAQALLAIPTAASRPVPGVEIEITDTYGMRETFTDGSRAATPSTEEGGR